MSENKGGEKLKNWMRRIWVFVFAAVFAVASSPLVARASAPTVDPDLSDAIDTMAGTVKVNAMYAGLAIITVALIIWLLFWAFGKLKRTAGR